MIKIKPTEVYKAFTEKPKPLDFVLPGMLSGTVGALISPGGVGKSMFALQLATQIAGAEDRLGLGKLTHGEVVYLPAEDPEDTIIHRLYMLGEGLSTEEKKLVAKNLVIKPLFGNSLNLLDPAFFDWVLKSAQKKRLIIIDTLRRFHNEDENTSGAMARVIGQMEAICHQAQCSLLFIHHSNKSSSASIDRQQSSRGSGVLVDNIRWQAYLGTLSKKEAESLGVKESMLDFIIKFGISKQNYGIPMQEILLNRNEGGFLTELILRPSKKKYNIFEDAEI